MDQEPSLCVLVSSDKNMPHLLGLAGACSRKGVLLSVFFSGDGVLLSRDPNFAELCGLCWEVFLCRVGCKARGIEQAPEPLDEDSLANQARFAKMLKNSQRFVSM